jgi:hypothetical protein
MAIYINTTGATETVITKDTNNDGFQHAGSISSISISNNNITNNAVVSLRLVRDASDTYIVRNVVIPNGVILLLDHDITFNVNNYALHFDNDGTSPNVTIIIK